MFQARLKKNGNNKIKHSTIKHRGYRGFIIPVHNMSFPSFTIPVRSLNGDRKMRNTHSSSEYKGTKKPLKK